MIRVYLLNLAAKVIHLKKGGILHAENSRETRLVTPYVPLWNWRRNIISDNRDIFFTFSKLFPTTQAEQNYWRSVLGSEMTSTSWTRFSYSFEGITCSNCALLTKKRGLLGFLYGFADNFARTFQVTFRSNN